METAVPAQTEPKPNSVASIIMWSVKMEASISLVCFWTSGYVFDFESTAISFK